ncbi:MAG: hypothetical protein WKF86_01120 [Acidimicrobiales bacterium]
MATIGRILGLLCMLIAAAIGGFATYAYVAEPGSSSPDFSDNSAEDLALLGLLSVLGVALVLATIGVTAVVAGNAFKRLQRDLHQATGKPSTYTSPLPPAAPPPWQPPTGTVRPPAAEPLPPPPLPPPPIPVPPSPVQAPGTAQWAAPAGGPPQGGGPMQAPPPPQPPGGGGWQPPPGPPAR